MTWSNNNYLHALHAFQIHWLSIINSVVLVFLLIGFVVIILVNTCRSLWYCWLIHVLIKRILHVCAKIWNVFWIVEQCEWVKYFSAENTNFISPSSHEHVLFVILTPMKLPHYFAFKFFLWKVCFLCHKSNGDLFMCEDILQGKTSDETSQWWHCKMLAVFSSYLRNSV